MKFHLSLKKYKFKNSKHKPIWGKLTIIDAKEDSSLYTVQYLHKKFSRIARIKRKLTSIDNNYKPDDILETEVTLVDEKSNGICNQFNYNQRQKTYKLHNETRYKLCLNNTLIQRNSILYHMKRKECEDKYAVFLQSPENNFSLQKVYGSSENLLVNPFSSTDLHKYEQRNISFLYPIYSEIIQGSFLRNVTNTPLFPSEVLFMNVYNQIFKDKATWYVYDKKSKQEEYITIKVLEIIRSSEGEEFPKVIEVKHKRKNESSSYFNYKVSISYRKNN